MPHQRRIASQSSQSSQLSPLLTASASSPSTPLLSPATRPATVSLGEIQIHSPNPTSESDTDMASVTTTHQQHFVNDLPLKPPQHKDNLNAYNINTTLPLERPNQLQLLPISVSSIPTRATSFSYQPYANFPKLSTQPLHCLDTIQITTKTGISDPSSRHTLFIFFLPRRKSTTCQTLEYT